MSVPAHFTHQITCSLLPIHMRELYEQWKSSGSVSAYDFGTGLITASNIHSDVHFVSASLVNRLDALSMDYSTSFAFGPIETGSVVSGSIFKSWRAMNFYDTASQTGTIYLTRENDTGDNWRSDVPLFSYSGTLIKEVDLTFDQAGRPVVSGDRDVYLGTDTGSLVWLYRFDATFNDFIFTSIATGSNPRIMLDDLIDSSNSDVIAFYIRRIAPEQYVTWVYATGSGVSGSVQSYYGIGNEVTLSLNPYWVSSAPEIGVFQSNSGTGASTTIIGSFNSGMKKVGAIAVGASVTGNYIVGFDVLGNEVQRKQFNYSPASSVLLKSFQILTASGDFGTGSNLIVSFSLIPGTTDYVAYDAIVFEPTSSITSSRNWSINEMFWEQQRDRFLVEQQVPIIEASFFGLNETPFVYEMFLEDVVKQTDSRLALWVTRRNIDSGSSMLGEYRINKFETVLYPIPSQEDQYSASVDFQSGSFATAIIHSLHDIDAFVSMSGRLPSGSHELHLLVVTHSIHDIEAFVSMSGRLPSGSHTLTAISTASMTPEAFASMSGRLPSGSHQFRVLTIVHTAHDIESFVSLSATLTSGSLL